MKKGLLLLLVALLVFFSWGCTDVLGGIHQREMGAYHSFLSDGEDRYWDYHIGLCSGYVDIGEDGFRLVEGDAENLCLETLAPEGVVVLYGYRTESFHGDDYYECEEGFSNLPERVEKLVDGCENYECVIIKNGDEVYGAVNCYKRASGRSGNLLSYEDLDRSYLIAVEAEDIRVVKELEGIAVLAFTQSHYLAYADRTFYAAGIESDERVEVCADIWWDEGPTFYSFVDVYFADDLFMICGRKMTQNREHITLIVGKMSGEYIETLIDNKKVEN